MAKANFAILRNTVFNVLGWVIPVVANIVSVPIIIRYLGPDRYGVWTLVMAIMGYFALLDLGVIKGGVKFLSEYTGKKEIDRASQVVSFGLLFYFVIGLLGAGLIASAVEPVFLGLLNIPAPLEPLARHAFYLAAPGFLVAMIQTYLLSLPQAAHRFDISNVFDVLSQIITIGATIAVLAMGYDLVAVLWSRIAIGVATIIGLAMMIRKAMPGLRLTRHCELGLVRRIFAFSSVSFLGRLGAVSTSQLQTIVIGALLGTSAVTAFSVPFQLVSRVMGISSRLSTVLFPIASELSARPDREHLQEIYLRLVRHQAFLNITLVVVLSVLSWQILALWIGPTLADQSAAILAISAVGIFFDSLTNLSSQICDGLGRPRLTSGFALARGLLGVVVTIVGAKVGGIVGVAIGYLLSSVLTSLAFNLTVHTRIIGIPYVTVVRSEMWTFLFGTAVAVVAIPFIEKATGAGRLLFLLSVECGIMGFAFSCFGYFFVLTSEERERVVARATRLLRHRS